MDSVILSVVKDLGTEWNASLASGTNLALTGRMPHFVQHDRPEGSCGLDSRGNELYK